MAYKPLSTYAPAPKPALEASKDLWVERELKRLQTIINELQAAIVELRAKVP